MTDIYEKPSLDELMHFGVKGMKWGRRKAAGVSAASPSAKPKKLTRQENREAKNKFYADKAERLLATALKDPEVLVKLEYGDGYPTVVTGKEFVNHLTNGGTFNVKYTDVFAQKTGDGPYVLNDAPNQRYKRGG